MPRKNIARHKQKLRVVPEPDFNNPASVYLSSLAPSGRRSILSLLKTILRLLKYTGSVESYSWHKLNYQQVSRIRFLLVNAGKSPNTVNLGLAGLKGIANAAFNMGLMHSDTLLRIRAVKRVNHQSGNAGRSLSKKEVGRLIKTCETNSGLAGIRDRAIIAILATTGIRRSELASLQIADYNAKRAILTVKQGKGYKDHDAYVPPMTRRYIKSWLLAGRGGSGPLFTPITKYGQTRLRPLSSQSIYNIVTSRSSEAGIGICTPHDFRRSYITWLLDSGIDINIVRGLANHADIRTTSKYDYRKINMAMTLNKVFSN